MSEQGVPSESAMRRALRRARDGVALDPVEATVLLHARGDALTDLMGSAGGGRGVPGKSGGRGPLRRAGAGVALDPVGAPVLPPARGDALPALMGWGGGVGDAGLTAAAPRGVVTYSRKVFTPLPRLCRDRCH